MVGQLEEKFERNDVLIKTWANKSDKAPTEFLEAELRRRANRSLMAHFNMDVKEKNFEDMLEFLEQEYQCYFETDKFKQDLEATSWWQFTYAGCNAQIQHFLMGNNFKDFMGQLGFEENFNPLEQVSKSELNNDVCAEFLINIGYLYPKNEEILIVHKNLLGAQNLFREGLDTYFLTRDLIRCPYFYQRDKNLKGLNLSNQKLWDYWKSLVTLSFGGAGNYVTYYADDFIEDKPIRTRIKQDDKQYFKEGKLFVPQRYLELEPEIEKFDWIMDESLYNLDKNK
ncbi:hypothetical protein HN385_03305 [archaeon]|jgi:hypothetical protein|nr:hypothetical protein [archaeon]MBT3451427.1 hypothetical protein [archaeon]MBT6869723.1 hypothetical protein [archaeon]MBT7192678.1 hypothetical protein [archaeon]MBT7380703.1 hypothetical protein [archaeon]